MPYFKSQARVARRSNLLVGAIAVGLFGMGAGAVKAADFHGSGAVITNRPCAASSEACVVGATRLQPHQYFGGYGQGLSTTNSLLGGASASADVSFGDDYLPVVRLASAAGAETRTGASATAFRSFTYQGDAAIDFSIAGDLHFLTSGDVLGPFGANEFAGDGQLNVALSILTVDAITSVFSASSTGVDIISNISTSFGECGAAGVLAAGGFNSAGMGGGEYNQTVGLSEACGGGAIRLNPGDSFVVVATIQSISNRSGFIDAAHTFRVRYDEENTFFAGTTDSVGEGFLARNVAVGAAVPEPATWALMIGGFGLAGASLRRQRRVTA